MAIAAFEESAENRKALDKLVRARKQNIRPFINKLEGLQPKSHATTRASKGRKKSP
jgi:hypothetical protein